MNLLPSLPIPLLAAILLTPLVVGCDSLSNHDNGEYETRLAGSYTLSSATVSALATPTIDAVFLGSQGASAGVMVEGIARPFAYVQTGRIEVGDEYLIDVGHEISLRTHFDATDGAGTDDAFPRCILAVTKWERVRNDPYAPLTESDRVALSCVNENDSFSSYEPLEEVAFTYDPERVVVDLPRTKLSFIGGNRSPELGDAMHVEGRFQGVVVSARAGEVARIPMPSIGTSPAGTAGPQLFSRGTLREDGSYETLYELISIGDASDLVVETGRWSASASNVTFTAEAIDGVSVSSSAQKRSQTFTYRLEGGRLQLATRIDPCQGADNRDLCLIGFSEQLTLGVEPAPLKQLKHEVDLELLRN